MKTKIKIVSKWFLSFAIFVLVLAGVQRLVQPKYASDIPEGNFTAEYYEETLGHDVILIGDCEVYENIDPMYLWSHFGVTSYIRGNAQQLTWQSYYMLEDTLRTETPKVVIYNVQALNYAEPQREEYNRMTLDGMRWSDSKRKAIQVSMCKGEQFLDYLFPLLRYHSRITELSSDDFAYYWNRRKVSHNGYYMRIDVLPASESDVADASWLSGEAEEEEEIEDPWAEIEGAEAERDGNSVSTITEKGKPFGSLPMEYLDRMRILCKKEGMQLILMKAPSLAPIWYESDNQQVVDYAEKYHLPYINFYELLKETKLDYEKDTYDGGLHMNIRGAGKLSEYLGNVLVKTYRIPDHREENPYKKVYEKKWQFYQKMIRKQQKELEQYGEIRSY